MRTLPPKALRDIWAELPALECKGECADRCSGVIAASAQEREQLEAGGKRFGTNGRLRCTMLRDGRCTAYSLRPLICRIWGSTERTRCPYGCEPERWLSDEEFRDLVERLAALSGETVQNYWDSQFKGLTRVEWRALETNRRLGDR